MPREARACEWYVGFMLPVDALGSELGESVAPSLPVGPTEWSLLQGFKWGFRRVQFLERCAARYGDIFTIRLGKTPLVVTARPADLRQLFSARTEAFVTGAVNVGLIDVIGRESLFVLDGAPHRRVRKLCLPAFSARRLEEYSEVLLREVEASLETMPRGPFALCSWLDATLERLIAKLVFGLSRGETDYDTLLASLSRITRTLTSSKAALMAFPALQRLLGPVSPLSDFRDAAATLEELVRGLVQKLRAGERSGTSILASLLAAEEAGSRLADDEVISQARTFVAAGVETVVSACAWTLRWLLASPQVMQALRVELAGCVQNGVLIPARVLELGLLDACVRESLRLSPPTATLVRIFNEDLRLDPYWVPAGTPVLGAIYLAHRRAAAFPSPGEYDPRRFQASAPRPFEWLPFGGGERRCIGMHAAVNEIKLIVAAVSHHRELTLCEPDAIRPVLRGTTLAPSGGLRVRPG